MRCSSEASSSFLTDHKTAGLARSHWTVVICELLIVLLFLPLPPPSYRSIINSAPRAAGAGVIWLPLPVRMYVCLYTCEIRPGAGDEKYTSDVNIKSHMPRVWLHRGRHLLDNWESAIIIFKGRSINRSKGTELRNRHSDTFSSL